MKTGKIVWSVFGICTGVLSIIASIVVWTMSVGNYEWNEAYGGDAYTGIQNAAAQTANNVQTLTELVRMALGFGLLIAGIVIICYFAVKICEAAGDKKTDKTTAEMENVEMAENTPVNEENGQGTEQSAEEAQENTEKTE